jgi:predicted glycoside hydrolase/deacetylase ChbG (UPF0249 family)
MTSRPIVLIADDYGLTPCISKSILMLIDAGRLSGTSAMVTGPHWPALAADLAARRDRAEAGLHIDLTTGTPLTPMPFLAPDDHFPSMPVLALKTLCFSQARAEVQAEIIRQIRAFATHYGHLPTYLDGHRHVHVLPGIRGALFAAIQAVDPHWRPWLRSVEATGTEILKKGVTPFKTLVISALSTGVRARARAAGLGVNDGFAGVSDFDPKGDFRADMQAFLAVSGQKPLIMVHPGLAGDEEIAALDAVVETRPQEHAYLTGDDFARDLEAAGRHIARFGDLA